MEFSLVASTALLMLFACMEGAWQAATAMALNQGAVRASRFGASGANSVAGVTGAPTCRSATIPWMVVNASGSFLRQDRLTVSTRSYATYADAAADRSGANGAGTGGQTVIYTLTYQQPYLFTKLVLGNAAQQHSATLLVKNEPFTDATC